LAEMIRIPKIHPDIADFVKNSLAPLLADRVLRELRKDQGIERDYWAQVELDKTNSVPG